LMTRRGQAVASARSDRRAMGIRVGLGESAQVANIKLSRSH
jgi:hypothetical protein